MRAVVVFVVREIIPIKDDAGNPIIPNHPAYEALTPLERRWGRFQLRDRSNSDQVPIPFCSAMRTTWVPGIAWCEARVDALPGFWPRQAAVHG